MSELEIRARGGLGNDVKAIMAFESEKKSSVIAYLLWFFLGGLGAHRFYLGRIGTAVTMLVLYILSWLLLFFGIGLLGLVACLIWWVIDAFLIQDIVRQHNHALRYRIEASLGAL